MSEAEPLCGCKADGRSACRFSGGKRLLTSPNARHSRLNSINHTLPPGAGCMAAEQPLRKLGRENVHACAREYAGKRQIDRLIAENGFESLPDPLGPHRWQLASTWRGAVAAAAVSNEPHSAWRARAYATLRLDRPGQYACRSHARRRVPRARLVLTRQRSMAHIPRSNRWQQRNRHDVLRHAAHASNVLSGNPHRLLLLFRLV